MPERLNVAFVWHMHQPYYRDSLTGEYMLPWVLLHGTKDYLHMAQVLRRYPKLHQTFNLVPSLLQQLTDYAAGRAIDNFLEVSRTPTNMLSDADKHYIQHFFFSISPDKVISRYPQYQELLRMNERSLHEGQELPDWFWGDTIGWFNLAWIDTTTVHREPELRELITREHFSQADIAAIQRTQIDLLRQIIPTYTAMRDAGQIELTTSPYYHPVLPLLIDNHRATLDAAPYTSLPSNHFRHPEDAIEQIRRGRVVHRELFGRAPDGLWPSEGSVSQALIYPLAQSGVRWIASDEEILNRSRGWSSRRMDGTVEDPASLYSAYRVHDEDYSLSILFRDRGLSDEIGFTYQSWQPEDAANDFIARLHGIRDALGDSAGDHVVPLILDGENCWEFYDNNGEDFLSALYSRLEDDQGLRCVTVSEFLDEHQPDRTLDYLASGSWIGGTFGVWIGEGWQNCAWEYLARTRDELVRWETECEGCDLGVLERAWEEIYIAEGSDWFWWYFSGNKPKPELGFDKQFRLHLANVYSLMGSPAPAYLGEPILT